MVDYVIDKWWKNKDKLEEALEYAGSKLYDYEYKDLMQKIVRYVLNDGEKDGDWREEVDTLEYGSYQGVIVFIIPQTSMICRGELLITCIDYGSCSWCDALSAAQSCDDIDDMVGAMMNICKDLVTNTVRPFDDMLQEPLKVEKKKIDRDNIVLQF